VPSFWSVLNVLREDRGDLDDVTPLRTILQRSEAPNNADEYAIERPRDVYARSGSPVQSEMPVDLNPFGSRDTMLTAAVSANKTLPGTCRISFHPAVKVHVAVEAHRHLSDFLLPGMGLNRA
jgi:hypothetical protein